MARRFGWKGGSLLALVLVFASSASAQVFSPFTFGGTLGWPYGFYQRDTVPYYSLFPPVYYSAPVARTYGYSPFAYPPGTMTPDIVPFGEPEIIENPHVQPSSKKPSIQSKSATDKHASVTVPKLIDNPFVEQAQIAAE